MKIDNIGFNLFIPKLNNIRQLYMEIENGLKEYFFAPFTILPIPEDVAEEVPRIVAKSKNGHSELVVSLINVQLTIQFDDNFNKDIEMCFDYILQRINKVIEVFGKYSNDTFLFSGITARIILDDIDDPIEFLNNNCLKVKSSEKMYNASTKFAFLIEDKYFVNFNIYNLRTFEGIVNEGAIKPNVNELSNKLAIEMDINDKFGYNHNDDHICTKTTINHIIDITKRNIYNNTDNILKGKELIL